ncbi:hypothetical protein ACQ4PT_006929 [Festuca glaucescens]
MIFCSTCIPAASHSLPVPPLELRQLPLMRRTGGAGGVLGSVVATSVLPLGYQLPNGNEDQSRGNQVPNGNYDQHRGNQLIDWKECCYSRFAEPVDWLDRFYEKHVLQRTRDEIKLKFDDVTIDEKTYVECFKPGGLMNSKILHLICHLWSQSMDDAIILQEASVLELLSGTNYKVLKNDLTADKAHKEKIFIPLAGHGHFSLVVVLKTTKEKLIIDSLPATHDIIIDSPETHDSMALTLLRELDSYLLDTHGVDISEYSVKRPNVQPQDNNRDCGFHVLLYIDGLKLGNVSDISNITTERVSVFRAELSASLYNRIGNEKNVVSEVEVDPNEDDGKIVETGDPSANLQEVDRNEHQNNGSVPLHTSAENTPEELSSGTVVVTAAAVLVAPLETVNIVQPGSSSVATTAPEKNDGYPPAQLL